MAYNKSYNPDALPAHAEPEQVAQMMGKLQVSGPGTPNQKPLPTRPPPQKSPVPPRVPVSSAPPPQAYQQQAPAPSPLQPTYNARPPAVNYTSPGGAQSHPPHPLYPSPPPQNYGFGPPPPHPSRERPPPASRPPTTTNPPPLSVPTDDPQQLFPLFRAANSSHSGVLTEAELGSALVNGDYTSFHPRTVKMMIRMFDRDSIGKINFDEFVSLWRYLAAWRELFDRFDDDRSGRINLREFENALVAFGYRLSPQFISVLFKAFESKTRQIGPPKSPQLDGMSFDLFVQACISLKRMTDVFKRYDDDRDGYITVSFEEFLTEILQLQD
ncbi:EF-hand [Penicillium lagena]|uniref:EF-hand n=1 Tax=Penicillium lagena TaxID=94218 RepID=UPI002540AA34|nr:EF-hand [Penicillium lagena]KAJ5624178.1 EF-hand [Penicillium lagena]